MSQEGSLMREKKKEKNNISIRISSSNKFTLNNFKNEKSTNDQKLNQC